MDEKQSCSAELTGGPENAAAIGVEDAEPQPPVEPPLEACCASGCAPCIFDDYAEQMNEYRVAHMAWKARQTARIKPDLE